MDVSKFLRDLTGGRHYRGQIVTAKTLPGRPARYGECRLAMPEAVLSALRRQNIHRLYTHQAAAIDALREGRDVVVVTGTASGKTVCYNAPVAAELLQDPQARALYMFPTKALAQDQLGAIERLRDGSQELSGVMRAAVYDGDTPAHNRAKIRSDASVVLTNPDMLHVGILPYHAKWHAFLRSLRYIVIDELHTYRGIFGSHVALVLRRLLRLCEHYGSRPRVVCCSATIANPVELARSLTGREPTLVDDDGAPRGGKHFVLWNPPLLDKADSGLARRSANIEAVELLCELVRRRTQTIVFCKARVVAELVYKYASEALKGEGDLSSRIRPYRGGYLPNERREIEQELFAGRLLAVSSTTALELGIDVGALDAALLVGFPGTICSTWQQAGRAGRTSQDSLVVMLAYNDPIDQYLMRHPEYLFGASHENAVIDPGNPHILSSQIACACFEKPLTRDDERFFGPMAAGVADILAEEGQVKKLDGRAYWRSAEAPARACNLRTISPETYAIADASAGGKVIGNVDSISAPELIYPQAIYLHEGRSYLVRELDIQAKLAKVEPAEVDYYTQPVLAHSCLLHEPADRRDFLDGKQYFGPADVTWQTTAFRKVKYYTMELVGQCELDLPSQTLATTAMWWTVSQGMRNGIAGAGFNPVEALVGVRNLMLAALPALSMCDRRDISGMVDFRNLGEPTIVVYDRYRGGLGFAQRGYELIDQWLELCDSMVRECPCDDGCPSCVGLANLRPPIHHDPDLGGGYPVPNKTAALLLLNMIRDALRK
jgi:DEAD/DEAH box helicase domain-containing protein